MEGSASSSSSQGDHKFCVQSMLSVLRIDLSFEAELARPDRAWRLIASKAAAAMAAASALSRLLLAWTDSEPSIAAAAVTTSASPVDVSGLTNATESSGVGPLGVTGIDGVLL